MRLKDIIGGLRHELLCGDLDIEITSLAYDSRECSQGSVFFCIRGFSADGHAFIPEAAARGASVLVVEAQVEPIPGITIVRFDNTREAMAVMASNFFGNPSEKLDMTGVTGTNGKTSIAFMIDALFREMGKCVGLLGTVTNRIGDEDLKVKRTTPESLDLQALLARMLQKGCSNGVMEVSSHAVALSRIANCKFGAGILTNVTQDHLDFHKDFQDYLETKKRFFTDYVAEDGVKILNRDDEHYDFVREGLTGKVITYGMKSEDADVRAVDIVFDNRGIEFTVKSGFAPDFRVSAALLGRFNVANALAMTTYALARGVQPEVIVATLKKLPCVAGRFERVEAGQQFTVIVDYAHTPDGLENVLLSAREICKGRLIVVFGAGGDRDRTKRPIMGAIAARLADFVIVTSDNPRTEEPYRIMENIINGITQELEKVEPSKRFKYLMEEDRYTAIRTAVSAALPDDVIVIAGKGHEDYQIFRDRTIYFDDRVVSGNIIQEILANVPNHGGEGG